MPYSSLLLNAPTHAPIESKPYGLFFLSPCFWVFFLSPSISLCPDLDVKKETATAAKAATAAMAAVAAAAATAAAERWRTSESIENNGKTPFLGFRSLKPS